MGAQSILLFETNGQLKKVILQSIPHQVMCLYLSALTATVFLHSLFFITW